MAPHCCPRWATSPRSTATSLPSWRAPLYYFCPHYVAILAFLLLQSSSPSLVPDSPPGSFTCHAVFSMAGSYSWLLAARTLHGFASAAIAVAGMGRFLFCFYDCLPLCLPLCLLQHSHAVSWGDCEGQSYGSCAGRDSSGGRHRWPLLFTEGARLYRVFN